VAGILLRAGACAPLSGEEKLRWDLVENVYWDAARECVGHYGPVRLVRLGRDGDLQADLAAESRSELRAFSECSWDGSHQRVGARRQKGLPVPDPLDLQRGVDAE
jgi:hypothetical protein